MPKFIKPVKRESKTVSDDERIRRYLDKCDPAINGNGGHAKTFAVACAVSNGFALDESTTLEYLRVYNQRCDPPWSDKELAHKAHEAAKVTHEKQRGHFLSGAEPDPSVYRAVKSAQKPARAKATPLTLNPAKENRLPKALHSPTVELLKAAFREGETICVEPAVYTDRDLQTRLDDDPSFEGEFMSDAERVKEWPPARPSGKGMFKTREQWLAFFKKTPDALNHGGVPGVFVVLNPFPKGSKQRKDDAVEQFRHVLLEFDSISKEAQWSVIRESNVPCSAVIDSGGKSVHAWVRVDAATREQYDERAAKVFELFATYKPDTNCGNPARLSRLAGARRHVATQDLLAVNIGAGSFEEWASESGDHSYMQRHSLRKLSQYVAADDPNNLVGKNWLKREGSLLLIGQSGIGKSSLTMQLAVSWALGRPLFGLKPVGPLKIMLFQAENDEGDLAEQLQGVLAELDITEFDDEFDQVEANFQIWTDVAHIGKAFVDEAERKLTEFRPDIVIVDPLLSFIGADISKQEVCSQFLRQWLNPVSKRHKFAWMLVHHPNKPKLDKSGSMTIAERAYAGAGSAELTNWARGAVIVEEEQTNSEAADRIFVLCAAKRGARAGLLSVEGDPTTQIWLEHAKNGRIAWLQRPEPALEEKPRREQKKRARSFKRGKADTEPDEPKKIGRPSLINADWIESVLGDYSGSARGAGIALQDAFPATEGEDSKPSLLTFTRALAKFFDHEEITQQFVRKEIDE